MAENRKKPLLFEKFPDLEANIPWIKLAPLRTPIKNLTNLQEMLGLDSLWLKQDNLTSPIYGGNKTRKLEFLLADALKKECTKVMTVGAIGSNHCVANAAFCKELKLKPVSALTDQPITTYVRNNLLLELYFKAEILYSPDREGLQNKIQSKLKNNTGLYFHGPGGSTPLGILGFVNAVLELKDQINNGEMPEPDYIYNACGSMGTTAGLSLGIKLAGLKTIIYSIKVSHSPSVDGIIRLANKGWKLLEKNDKKIPKITYEHLQLDGGYFGDSYGKPTKECLEAVKLLKEKENVILEPTYTGKAMAGLIGNAQKEKLKLKDKTILFWNTFNSRDYSEILKTMDYHNLPKELYWIFEEPKPII